MSPDTTTTMAARPRLKERYLTELQPALQQELGLELRPDRVVVTLLEARLGEGVGGHQRVLPHLRQMRTLVPSSNL